MPVPNTFANATATIPLSQLDANFATTITLGNTAIQLGNTVSTLNNMTLANVTVTSGNVTITNVTVTTANVTTANIATAEIANVTVSGTGTFAAGSNTAPSITTSGNTNTGIFFPAADTVAIGTGGTEALRVNSSQNVGIGTSSPATLLNAYSATNASFNLDGDSTVAMRASRYSTDTSQAAFQFRKARGTLASPTAVASGDATGAISFQAYGGSNFRTTASVQSLVETYTSDINIAGYLVFSTNGGSTAATERMRLDSPGNLGLGVTPSAWKSNYKAVQVGNAGQLVGRTDANQLYAGSNWFVNSSNQDIYQNNGNATIYAQNSGSHIWYNAPSGTAGAQITFTTAMTLDASGNLGVGVTSPTVRLDVAGSLNTTSRARFEKTGTGKILQLGADRDTTAVPYIGSESNHDFSFITNNTERARITAAGEFLVGTTDIAANSGIGVKARPTGAVFAVGSSSLSDTYNYFNTTAGAYRFYVTNAGVINATSTTITAISDQRLKENIEDIDVGLAEIMALQPRKFDWKEGKGKDIKSDRGWIAQEFEQVFPDMISTWKDEPPEGEEPYKAVNADLIPILVKAIQELNAKVEAQAAEIAALKGNA